MLRLADVCLKIQDGTHFSPKVQYADAGPGRFKYITSKNIRPWGLDLSDITYVSEQTHREIYGRCDPQFGDILLTKDGVNTGTVAINPLNEEFSLLSSVAILRPRRGILDSRFLRYFIESPQGSRNIVGKMSGTAIRRIILKRIKEATIPVPSLDEQQRIVADLEKQFTRLEAGVASLKRLQAALKRYRASVLKAACKGNLTAEWRAENHPDESAADLLTRIKTEREARYQQGSREAKTRGMKKPVKAYQIEFRKDQELPESWATAKLDNLIYIAGRIGWRGLKADEYTQDGPLFLSVYNLNYGEAVDYRDAYHVSRERYEESPEIMLRNDDILLAKDGAGIGKVGIIKQLPKEATINSSLLLIRALEAFVPKYLFYFLAGPELQVLAKQRIAGSATPHLFQKDIRQFYLSVPSLAEQTRIVAEVERRLSVIEELEGLVKANLMRATRLRQSILQKAFSTEGESW